jgi:hypothetical protein
MLKLILLDGVAVLCGLALGAVRGVGAAANEAAGAGLDVTFRNPVLRFLLRPTKHLTFNSALLFLLMVVVWLPTFVVVVGLPYLVAMWVSVLASLKPWWSLFAVEFAAMFVGAVIGRRIAARWWP